MSAPAVSVIIPTYNRAHVLPRALQSVAGQTYSDYEIIVVDDGLTDGTPSVIDHLSPAPGNRVTVLRSERNRGAASARNRGVREARGSYIAFLDADDEWAPTKLEKQIARFQASPQEVGLITTGYVLFERGGTRSDNPLYPREGDLSASMPDFIGGQGEIVGVFSTLMFRRSVIDRVGGLDETLSCWEDADFYFRAASHFHFAFVPEALVLKHDSADSISSNWSLEAAGARTFWQRYRPHVGSRPGFRRYIARHQHGMAVLACRSGHLAEGRRLFRESLAILPSQWHPVVHYALSLSGARTYDRILSLRERLRARSVNA